MSQFVDLSHVIEAGMTTYPGLPGPVISVYMSYEASRLHYAAGTEFQIGRIEMVANTGTYVDAPAHRFQSRATQRPGPCSASGLTSPRLNGPADSPARSSTLRNSSLPGRAS